MIKQLVIFLIACTTVSLFLSCQEGQDRNKSQEQNNSYTLPKVDTILTLHQSITEASGLAYDVRNRRLLTHDDERGHYYSMNPDKAKVKNKVIVGPNEDYEGIAWRDDVVTMISSRGVIRSIDQQNRMKHTFSLIMTADQNIEGMCYDRTNDQYLLAGKGTSLYKNGGKTIYSLSSSLKSNTLSEWVSIYPKTLELFENGRRTIGMEEKVRLDQFAPSGIAIQPSTNKVWVLSSKGHLLIILDKDGVLQDIIYLDEKALPKPEGICFDDQGTLYLATEGVNGPSRIFKYNLK